MDHGTQTPQLQAPQTLIGAQLAELQADPAKSALFSVYVAALTDEAGWGVEVVAGLAGASRQSISKRRKQGRELREGFTAELAGLPLPQAPAKEARTRSGLRIPDAEAIRDREFAWVQIQLSLGANSTSVVEPQIQGIELGGAEKAAAKAEQATKAEEATSAEQATSAEEAEKAEGAGKTEAEAKAEVAARAEELAKTQARNDLRLAAGLLEDTQEKLLALKAERAQLAWRLTCFDPKARQGLQKAGHWQPDEFFEARSQALASANELKGMDEESLAELGRARGLESISDLDQVRDEYFAVTTHLLQARARQRAVTEARDERVRRYVQRDANGRWRGVTEVAEWIGRTQAQVTQICDQSGGSA